MDPVWSFKWEEKHQISSQTECIWAWGRGASLLSPVPHFLPLLVYLICVWLLSVPVFCSGLVSFSTAISTPLNPSFFHHGRVFAGCGWYRRFLKSASCWGRSSTETLWLDSPSFLQLCCHATLSNGKKNIDLIFELATVTKFPPPKSSKYTRKHRSYSHWSTKIQIITNQNKHTEAGWG